MYNSLYFQIYFKRNIIQKRFLYNIVVDRFFGNIMPGSHTLLVHMYTCWYLYLMKQSCIAKYRLLSIQQTASWGEQPYSKQVVRGDVCSSCPNVKQADQCAWNDWSASNWWLRVIEWKTQAYHIKDTHCQTVPPFLSVYIHVLNRCSIKIMFCEDQ